MSSGQCLRSKLAFLRPSISRVQSRNIPTSLSIRSRCANRQYISRPAPSFSLNTSVISQAQSAVAAPSISFRLPSILLFDKVPDKLPDWWDDDDDDDENDSEESKAGGGGDGNFGGGGGNNDDNQGGKGDGEDPKSFFAILVAMYTRSISRYPIRTKAFSTLLLAMLGDYCAQRIAQRNNDTFSLDRRRSLSIGIWGFCFMGPVLHHWYAALDRMFFGRYAVAFKLLCDQLMFAPMFNSAFLAGTGILEGNSWKTVAHSVRTKFWASMKANWTLWPAAQFVNFTFVPPIFQVLYVNGVALLWNIILTYISHE